MAAIIPKLTSNTSWDGMTLTSQFLYDSGKYSKYSGQQYLYKLFDKQKEENIYGWDERSVHRSSTMYGIELETTHKDGYSDSVYFRMNMNLTKPVAVSKFELTISNIMEVEDEYEYKNPAAITISFITEKNNRYNGSLLFSPNESEGGSKQLDTTTSTRYDSNIGGLVNYDKSEKIKSIEITIQVSAKTQNKPCFVSIQEIQIYDDTPDNGITSTFYINSSAENVLNKSLTEIKSVKYQVWEPFDILHPTLTVRRDDALLDCNYVYIPKFNRYYFATIQVQKGNEMIVSCDIDPLESWKTRGLLDLSVPVIRQENKYNMYITDSKMPFMAKGEKQIVKISGGDNPFLESSQDTGEHFLLNSL